MTITISLANNEQIEYLDGFALDQRPSSVRECSESSWIKVCFPTHLYIIEKEESLLYNSQSAIDFRKQLDWKERSVVQYDLNYFNSRNGDVYNNDNSFIIHRKCISLIFFNPLVSSYRCVSSFVNALFLTVKTGFSVVLGKNWDRTWKSADAEFCRSGRAIKYGLLMEKAAFQGLVNPLEGRADYGKWERTFNQQDEKVDFKTAFYTASCYQPLANIHDEDFATRMKNYLHKKVQFQNELNEGRISITEQRSMILGCTTWSKIAKKKNIVLEEMGIEELG